MKNRLLTHKQVQTHHMYLKLKRRGNSCFQVCSDIGLEFWTSLLHYSDINAGPCSIWSGVYCDISWGLLTFD